MGDPIRRAALRQDRTGALPARDRTRHVAARGRDRRHHVEQRRADVRERHPRLRRFGKDAFAGRADLRDALRRGEHLRNAGAGGADYAPDGGARRQDPSQRETFRTDQSCLRPSRRAGTRRRAEPSAGEDLPQFRARRSAARRRAEGASEGDQRGAVAHGREVRAEPPRREQQLCAGTRLVRSGRHSGHGPRSGPRKGRGDGPEGQIRLYAAQAQPDPVSDLLVETRTARADLQGLPQPLQQRRRV